MLPYWILFGTMSSSRLPPLNALKAFDAAARCGGFRAAATELNVTHSVIGRHIRGLEHRLGVELFKTNKRGVELTEAGWLYADRVGTALSDIAAATDDVRRQYGTDQIHVQAIAGFAAKWLSPRLPLLAERFPNLLVFAEPLIEIEDGVVGDADFAIGFGRESQLDGELEFLAAPSFYPVCSPGYIARRGPFDEPQDLLRSDLLHEDFGDWWREWFDANGIRFEEKARMVFWSAGQAIDAAVEGQGIALANDLLVASDLKAGRLVKIDAAPFDGGAYWLIWRDGITRSDTASAVASWIKEQASQP